MLAELVQGDCLEVMPTLTESSIDAIITDPPFGLEFLGLAWDKFQRGVRSEAWACQGKRGGDDFGGFGQTLRPAYGYLAAGGPAKRLALLDFYRRWGQEALRVAKPGSYLCCFSIPRLQDWAFVGLQLAGWVKRDQIAWIYWQGFPKNYAIDKAWDRRAGYKDVSGQMLYTPLTAEAQKWRGWGTALKPAHEDIGLFQKPLEGTYLANIETWGVGALNIDACRIPYISEADKARALAPYGRLHRRRPGSPLTFGFQRSAVPQKASMSAGLGRFPPNCLDDTALAEAIGMPLRKDQGTWGAEEKPKKGMGVRSALMREGYRTQQHPVGGGPPTSILALRHASGRGAWGTTTRPSSLLGCLSGC